MIITKKRNYKAIKKELKKSDRIGILSCNACARICGTGGEKELKKIYGKLKKDGYNVVDMDLIGVPCDYSQLQKKELHGDVQVVLACDAGIYNLRKLFPKHKIISTNKTLGIGAHDGKKLFLVKKVC